VRAVHFVRTLPDRRVVESLVRGRGWIFVLGFLLMGIVAMQVSLLKLNAGIGRDVERAASLDRRNGELRAEVSRLSSGERIQESAASLGMVMPPAGAVTYLRGHGTADVQDAVVALQAGKFAPGAPVSPPPSLPSPAAGGVVATDAGGTAATSETETAAATGTTADQAATTADQAATTTTSPSTTTANASEPASSPTAEQGGAVAAAPSPAAATTGTMAGGTSG
jgi:hypothetical protein